jgi:hypothetical protein
MNTMNEVGFVKSIWAKFKKLLVADAVTLVAEVDSDGSVRKMYESASAVVMDEDWCVPVHNMKYEGFTLIVNDESIPEVSFKTEEIEEWNLSSQDRIVIGPFDRKTCDTEYLKPFKMRELFSELCSAGTYDLNVRTKTGSYRIEINVVDAW